MHRKIKLLFESFPINDKQTLVTIAETPYLVNNDLVDELIASKLWEQWNWLHFILFKLGYYFVEEEKIDYGNLLMVLNSHN
jgi:hypothetical protein